MCSENDISSMDNSKVTPRDIENLLKKIGMTEYKAKIYRVLVENGVCDAKKISELSNVPVT
ncbi:MAG: helix-turn-helix domain-containing protein, partial [Candidatus Aenigmatarchaeota archaeon]